MTETVVPEVLSEVRGQVGLITLNRPRALNALSLGMVRELMGILLAWQSDARVLAVAIRGSNKEGPFGAFCAGGDIRFLHQAGSQGNPQLEDFFTEEYALNHLIHNYAKPYIAFMDGIVMGGGMGVAEGGEANRMRIVTERTKMAMPEMNIGLFPDVGGGYFLSRTPGQIGAYLGVTGETIATADALYAGLADIFVPSDRIPTMLTLLASSRQADVRATIREFAAPYQGMADTERSTLATNRAAIDRHFAFDDVRQIVTSLASDSNPFAQKTLEVIRKRSPLMMCVTLAQLRRSASLTMAECLRLERTMVRRCLEHGEVLEGVRALVIDKDNAPRWDPPTLEEVRPEAVARFFESAWPSHAHPLRWLE